MEGTVFASYDVIEEADLELYLDDLRKMHPSEENINERYFITSILDYGRTLRSEGYTPVYLQSEPEDDEDETMSIILTVEEPLTYH